MKNQIKVSFGGSHPKGKLGIEKIQNVDFICPDIKRFAL